MTFKQRLANNIREARMSNGMSQYELAQRIGVTDSCVSLYETGKRMPNMHTMAIMSDVLGTSLDDLVPHVTHEMPVDQNQTMIFDFIGDDVDE